MLYFLSVSEGILASTVEFSPAWYRSCSPPEFIYNSWSRPEMLRVASLVCLTNQRTAVIGDLPFLNHKYNMPFDFHPPTTAVCHVTLGHISLSVCPACFPSAC